MAQIGEEDENDEVLLNDYEDMDEKSESGGEVSSQHCSKKKGAGPSKELSIKERVKGIEDELGITMGDADDDDDDVDEDDINELN